MRYLPETLAGAILATIIAYGCSAESPSILAPPSDSVEGQLTVADDATVSPEWVDVDPPMTALERKRGIRRNPACRIKGTVTQGWGAGEEDFLPRYEVITERKTAGGEYLVKVQSASNGKLTVEYLPDAAHVYFKEYTCVKGRCSGQCRGTTSLVTDANGLETATLSCECFVSANP